MENKPDIPGLEDPYFSIEKEYKSFGRSRPFYEDVGEVARCPEEISIQLSYFWEQSKAWEDEWFFPSGSSRHSVAVWEGHPAGGKFLVAIPVEIWLLLVPVPKDW